MQEEKQLKLYFGNMVIMGMKYFLLNANSLEF